MNDKEILIKTRELLSDEDNWTTRAFARDAEGQEVSTLDAHACRYCVYGAIAKFRGVEGQSERRTPLAVALESSIEKQGPRSNVVFVNDVLGRTAVLELLDRAISVCGE